MEAEEPELCRLLLSLREARLLGARDVELSLLLPKNLVSHSNMELQHQDPLRMPKISPRAHLFWNLNK